MFSVSALLSLYLLSTTMLNQDPKDKGPLTGLARQALRYTGIPTNKRSVKSLLLVAYHFTMITNMGITSALEIFLGTGDLIERVQALSAFSFYINIYAKVINILLYQTEILKFMERLEKFRLDVLLNCKENINQILSLESLGKKFIIAFTASCCTTTLCAAFSNCFADYLSDFKKPHLQFQVWLPFEMSNLPNYLMGVSFVTLIAITDTFYYVSFSTLQFAFTFEMSAFIRTLQYRLKMKGPADKLIYRYHQMNLTLLREFNELFSGQICVEIIASTFQPLGYSYALMKVIKNYDAGALYLAYISILCLAVPFTICACGQEIHSQMEKLHEYSYMNNWYEETPAVRRDLLRLMTITVAPFDVNYRRFVPFNYECFVRILRGTYSFMMLIINSDVI